MHGDKIGYSVADSINKKKLKMSIQDLKQMPLRFREVFSWVTMCELPKIPLIAQEQLEQRSGFEFLTDSA